MNFYRRRFNLYFLPAALLLLAAGCALLKKTHEQTGAVRIHVENGAGATGAGQSISVIRSQPVMVNIGLQPILTEADLLAVRLRETPGGFAVELQFDNAGSWTLEQFSAANPGRHLAIFGQWGKTAADGRWLAAPLITGRIASGTLIFTPDASREEAELLVKGLGVVATNNAGTRSKE